MADDARYLLMDYGAGKMTFQELSAKFAALKPPAQKPAAQNWGQVYAQAEEGDDSIAAVLRGASYAGNITAAEEDKLFAIYCKSNPSSPV